jgi:hypothetical protein
MFHLFFNAEDVSGTLIANVGIDLPDYVAHITFYYLVYTVTLKLSTIDH